LKLATTKDDCLFLTIYINITPTNEDLKEGQLVWIGVENVRDF